MNWGIADNTLVIFLGDNGSDAPLGHQHAVACAAPLRGKKGAHYEGGMRVPFIAAWARPDKKNPAQQKLPIARNSRQSQVASVCDVFPTVLGAAEVEIPGGHKVDGVKLNGLFTGKPDDSRDETFLMHYPHGKHRSSYYTVFRDGEWKVIYHYYPSDESEGGHYQLYNLKDDPFESTNLADQKPKELKSMMTRLAAELKQHEAHYPVDEDGTVQMPKVPKG